MTLNQPEDMPEAFRAAWMERDGKAIGELFTADADFVNVVGIWWEDREAIARAHGYALASFFSETRLTLGRVKTRRLGRDAAVVHARMILSGQRGRDGGEAGQRTGILSFVMERQEDGGWLCVSAQNTDIVPGAETLERTGDGLTPRDYRDR